MQLNTPLRKVLGTTKDHLQALENMGISSVEDLLLYLPRMHEDLTQVQTLTGAELDQKGSFRGIVEKVRRIRTRKGKYLVTAMFTDTEGATAEIIWFNQPHIAQMIKDGEELVLTGKLIANGNKVQIQSPQFEKATGGELLHAGRLVPVYPQHEIINTRWLREKMSLVKSAIALLPENLPLEILNEEDLIGRSEAITALHFPDTPLHIEQARKRIAFEDMYLLQCEVLERKQEWQGNTQERLKIPMHAELIRSLFASLHFTPTEGQRIAIYEILKDMEESKPMSRLLEGDVGSGKTLVAVSVMANVIHHGGQCALMVPTEVLARQHVQSIGATLIAFHKYLEHEHEKGRGEGQPRMPHPTIALLTGSISAEEANVVRRRIASGTVDLVIGTHSLIQNSVQFKDLKLVIVDEQHRFGVAQREALVEKGSPHFLSMTATPIPRTLALTAHGHHDLSVLTEKPGNRQSIDTKVVGPKDRKTVELFIDQQISEGRQAFVICPLISASEKDEMLEIRNVEEEAARLQKAFPRRKIAKLHGKMKPDEKETVMAAFKAKQSDILVSTSVIEVGIDVPNSTIMLIEGAERFGLSQLHQFRGRVGRGDHKSYCFLFTTNNDQARSTRLKAMEKHDSGFELAEIDLQLRGPGELYGFRQSGMPDTVLQSLLNPELVVRARKAATRMLTGVKS